MNDRWTIDAGKLPPEAGAYALLIEIRKTVVLPPRCSAKEIPPGTYVYVGSARGRGGIRARCQRHLRAEKSIHWHVDRLTVNAEPGQVRVTAFPGRSECALGESLSILGEGVNPVFGFGNTDCRSCPAHLFSIDAEITPLAILAALQTAG